jgi:hypothetical protein
MLFAKGRESRCRARQRHRLANNDGCIQWFGTHRSTAEGRLALALALADLRDAWPLVVVLLLGIICSWVQVRHTCVISGDISHRRGKCHGRTTAI